jgi:hypothetical protein
LGKRPNKEEGLKMKSLYCFHIYQNVKADWHKSKCVNCAQTSTASADEINASIYWAVK